MKKCRKMMIILGLPSNYGPNLIKFMVLVPKLKDHLD